MSAPSILNRHVNISLPVYFCVIRLRVDKSYFSCFYVFMLQPKCVASTDFGRIFWQYGSSDIKGLIIRVFVES